MAILEGRDAAVGTLRGALGRASSGRGQLAVVSGDAGIGKSTLATAIGAEAEASGFDVTWGRAWEFADAPPYFPLRTALRTLGIDPHRPDLREEGGSFRLWEEVVEALARAAKPTMWILEDLHAADLLTLDLLTFLAQALRGLRVLVVATTRAQDPRLDERALQRITRMARDGIDLRLSPLSANEVGSVAERVCGGPLPPKTIARLAEITGGNPLFVVECARSFKSAGTLTEVPPTIKQVVLERYRQLPADTIAALACGAILGREFTASMVGRMQSALPARVIDTVLPALRSGLVTELEPGRFAFSHVIVRDVVESALSAEERAQIHRKAEAALEKAPDSVDVAVERARHALEAAVLGDGVRAVDLARRAIRLLEEDAAHDRAWAFCERVISATATSPEIESALHVDDWMDYARIARAAGRHADCGRLCQRVLAEARARKDAKTFARATLLAGAEIRPAVVDKSLIGNLEEARAMLGDADAALACRLQARLAGALQPHDDFNVPIVIAREAIERARTLGEDVLVEVLDLGVSALVDFAPIDERLAAYEELLALATARGDRIRILRSRARLALDHAFVGDFAAFSRDVDESLRVASELGHPRFRWRALLLASMRALSLGDLAGSERSIVEVKELASLTDDPSLPMSLFGHRIHRALLVQREDELREIADCLPAAFATFPYRDQLCWYYRAMIAARIENAEDARAAIAGIGPDIRFFEREVSGAAALSEAIALAGTDEHRRRVRTLLEAEADHHQLGGHVPISYDGPVGRPLALLDEALGELPKALERLARARESATKNGHRAWIAQLEYDTARLLVKNGRAAEAQPHIERAASIAAEIGLERLAERARALTSAPAKAKSTAAMQAALAPPERATFDLAREGDVWRVTHGDTSLRVRDSRGMNLLARLVERPGDEIHVLALATDGGGGGLVETNAGDALDDKAKSAYRAKLRDLLEDIEEAERHADRGRLEKLTRERAFIEQEIARAVGLGGRARKDGSATERARVNVQRRLKDAIGRIAEGDADVGRFLEKAVRTGTFCCYRP
jgi:tetratricopeptide (TPR) repeat protein